MANYYIMPNATIDGFGGRVELANPDNIAYRGASEGHNADKQLRVCAFENSQAQNDFTVNHTLPSDTYLRFKKLVTEGTLQVGDFFVYGLIPNLSELDVLSVEQLNTVAGLQLKPMVLDSVFAPVEDEGLVIDFANECVNGRWDTQPAASYNYDEAGENLKALRGEFFYFATRVEAIDVAMFDECSCPCPLPEFCARIKYEDLCLMQGLDICAPTDVKAAYDAAIVPFLAANEVIMWNDIVVNKDTVMFGCYEPEVAPAPTP